MSFKKSFCFFFIIRTRFVNNFVQVVGHRFRYGSFLYIDYKPIQYGDITIFEQLIATHVTHRHRNVRVYALLMRASGSFFDMSNGEKGCGISTIAYTANSMGFISKQIFRKILCSFLNRAEPGLSVVSSFSRVLRNSALLVKLRSSSGNYIEFKEI